MDAQPSIAGPRAASAARSLFDAIAPRSDEIERARSVPADLIERMNRAGLFKLTIPRIYGGDEVQPVEVLQTIEEVAYADSSVGWCCMIYLTTAVNVAFLEPAWAERIYRCQGERTPITAGSTTPVGKARPVAGGMQVSGVWPWGSGTHHCDWIAGTAMLPGARADGPPVPTVFYFPRDEVELLDDWDASGLCGTGSGSFRVESAVVPEGRWVPLGGARRHLEGVLYRFPFFGLFSAGIAAVPLGLARRALDDFVELARVKVPTWKTRTINESSVVQLELGRAEALISGARHQLYAIVEELTGRVAAGDELSLEDRRRIRLAACQATASCAEAVDRLYDAGGGSSVYKSCSLQRHWRDIHTATAHRMVGTQTLQLAGAVKLLGRAPGDALL
ncbi:MAG: acyl-CoA dehydrogenase family protein [Myxococcota bacterium]